MIYLEKSSIIIKLTYNGGFCLSKAYSIRVRIGGRSFGIISDDKPEYLSQIAKEVNDSVTGLLSVNPKLTFEKAAILTALIYCDDVKKSKISDVGYAADDENNNLRKQVISYSNELTRLTKENKLLLKEIEELKKQIR